MAIIQDATIEELNAILCAARAVAKAAHESLGCGEHYDWDKMNHTSALLIALEWLLHIAQSQGNDLELGARQAV